MTTENNNGSLYKILLFIPPAGHPPISPHPATAYLKAYAERELKGIDIVQKDLNSIVYQYLLKDALVKYGIKNEEFRNQIGKALRAMQDEQIYHNFPKFSKGKKTLEEALRTISTRFEKEKLRLEGNTFTYVSQYSHKDRSGLLKSIQRAGEIDNRCNSLFYDFYIDKVLPYIKEQSPDLVGFTIYQEDQLIPTLVLSSLIKEKFPNMKIVFGGNYITRFYDIFSKDDKQNRELFDIIDFMIVYEGEIPFTELIKRLNFAKKEGKEPDLTGLNKLIYKNNGNITPQIDVNNFKIVDMDSLPTPDFDGLYTGLDDETKVHWTPRRVITYQTARGCYMSRGCDFCSNPLASDNLVGLSAVTSDYVGQIIPVRQRSVKKVVGDIEALMKANNTNYFSFADESLSPRFLREFSKEILERKIDITWDCYARIDAFKKDEDVDRDLVDIVSKAGCSFIQFGLESVDIETLNRMHKGYNNSSASELIKATTEAGIMNHLFVFIGYPVGKEISDEEYIKLNLTTLGFLEDNTNYFVTAKATPLMLPRDSKLIPKIENKFAEEITILEKGDLWMDLPYKKVGKRKQLDDLIVKIYDVWLKYYHGTNIVTRTYIYQQRLFLGLEKIREYSKTNAEEQELLHRLWLELSGGIYRRMTMGTEKIKNKAKRKKLEEKAEGFRQTKPTLVQYPDGFSSIGDILNLFK